MRRSHWCHKNFSIKLITEMVRPLLCFAFWSASIYFYCASSYHVVFFVFHPSPLGTMKNHSTSRVHTCARACVCVRANSTPGQFLFHATCDATQHKVKKLNTLKGANKSHRFCVRNTTTTTIKIFQNEIAAFFL